MALENLTPVTRMEAILDGADITPVTREEYFWQQAATSGYELPDVTAADDGDVLTVVSGAWAKAAPSGGGGQFIVTLSYDDHDTPVVDKTFSEISTALNGGSIPVIVYSGEDGAYYYHLERFEPSGVHAEIKFASWEGTYDALGALTGIAYTAVYIENDNSVIFGNGEITFTP